VELYEQIRREYEHGAGTIRAVARRLGVHRRARTVETGGGDSIHRCDSGVGQKGAEKAAAHGPPNLDAAAPRDARSGGSGVDGSPVCARPKGCHGPAGA
jgi:hypothetical protein